jgi:hypothetical protein
MRARVMAGSKMPSGAERFGKKKVTLSLTLSLSLSLYISLSLYLSLSISLSLSLALSPHAFH